MSTNVETGDLAIVVDTVPAEFWARNRIVMVGKQCNPQVCELRGCITWRLQSPLVSPRGRQVFCMPDWCLRRINPPAAVLPVQGEPVEA